ncbi:XRE family transcriptional regulator [Devosia limi DSM 17137]|uniref:XRE family transcriptional regulator n=1 Tax=Devosia limi DSM 17137 TaxID=1121477 RepID=A0A0F5LRB6_9HYPH|nr:DUF5680 domain-containing protein [Devosia limi]KKB84915.1 XRE family transcriptional regulator [Devosia limi DSM 17137]SHF05846.1 hypothetical protein SAMN02745223_01703 [Devosia limi DSM 17137]
MNIIELNRFIVAAKQGCYVGGGERTVASRTGSHDLVWRDGDWHYRDSYFGGTDFIGQETMWRGDEPVWAMNYYGFIIRPDLMDGTRAGETIKAALSLMYEEGRFLGGFSWSGPHGRYVDKSDGDVAQFFGREAILCDGIEAYALHYHGGLIRP